MTLPHPDHVDAWLDGYVACLRPLSMTDTPESSAIYALTWRALEWVRENQAALEAACPEINSLVFALSSATLHRAKVRCCKAVLRVRADLLGQGKVQP